MFRSGGEPSNLASSIDVDVRRRVTASLWALVGHERMQEETPD